MSIQRLTLEQLPLAVYELTCKVDRLTALLESNGTKSDFTATAEERPLNVAEAADFLGIAPQTVYQRIKTVPHKKRFGRLYFFRSQLTEYLIAGEGVGNE